MSQAPYTATPTMFRVLLLASLVLGLAGAVIDVFAPGLVPEVLWQALADVTGEDATWKDYVLMVAGVVLLAAAVVSVYGLYLFRRWAPAYSVIVTVATIPLYPMTNVSISSGWAVRLTEVSMMLWGAVLALAWSGPIAERFRG